MIQIQSMNTCLNTPKKLFNMDDIEFLEEKNPDEKFQYAFNSGYTLAKYQPEVLTEILFEIEQKDIRGLEGFKWGKWQYENEQDLKKLKEFAKIREKGKDYEKDKDFDRIW